VYQLHKQKHLIHIKIFEGTPGEFLFGILLTFIGLQPGLIDF